MNSSKGSLATALVFVSVLIASPTLAPAADVETKCMSSKLKAAGKDCACIHKELSKAVKKGLDPDFSSCEAKLADQFAKAEQKATEAGGQCPAGEPAAAVADQLAVAADRTVSQVGRGTISPLPEGCVYQFGAARYRDGNYQLVPKCAKSDTGTGCDSATIDKLEVAIAKDFSCPDHLCSDGEEGCEPRASLGSDDTFEKTSNFCCLKVDADDPKQSDLFSIACTLCFTP